MAIEAVTEAAREAITEAVIEEATEETEVASEEEIETMKMLSIPELGKSPSLTRSKRENELLLINIRFV